jgi:MscS family membrane protein
MMLLDKINACCEFTIGALDGLYGWLTEAIAIVLVVFIFNFLIRWLLKLLHSHYEKENKYWKDSFIEAIYKPLSYFIWFFAAVQAIDLISARIGTPIPIENRHVLIAVGSVLALAWFLFRWKRNIIHNLNIRSKSHEITIDQGRIGAIDKLCTVAIIFFIFLLMLEATDRSMNIIIAFGGIGGLALAFASQEVISNFFGGFMIYLTQPFTIGDWVSIPDHSIEGIVEDIGWYMTRVRSLDKRPIYIPNSIFSKLIIITPSRMSHRVFKETFNLRNQDLSKAKKITQEIKEMLQQHFDIDLTQNITARLVAFGAYSVDIYVSAYTTVIDNDGFLRVKEDLLFKIADIVAKNDADFAIPTQTIDILRVPKGQRDIRDGR